jgi:hypothetical protein
METTTMNQLLRPSILAAIAALLFLFPAYGQTFEPDPQAPGAQQQAEYLFIGAMLGMTPPPLGWNCWLESDYYDPSIPPQAVCEPDPVLIDRQQQERQAWLDRLQRNGRRIVSELRRRR